MRYINPVKTRVEDRFLAERIVLSMESSTAAIRALRRRLGNNGVVSVTAIYNQTVNPVGVPLLNGVLRLGSGALDLGYATGAPVLPVFAVREGPDRHGVRVEAALPVEASLSRPDAVRAAMAVYGERLLPYIRAFPDQWLGWSQMADRA
jgi:lauroyl/myristoyl acyltransferase